MPTTLSSNLLKLGFASAGILGLVIGPASAQASDDISDTPLVLPVELLGVGTGSDQLGQGHTGHSWRLVFETADLALGAEGLDTEDLGGVAQDLMPVVSGLGATTSTPSLDQGITDRVAQVRPANDGPGWEYVISPYVFVPFNVNAEVSVGGVTQSVSAGLGDIFDLDRVFSGAVRFEARHPQYGFFADVSHLSVRESQSVTNFPLPAEVANVLSAQIGFPIPPGTPTDAGTVVTGRNTSVSLGGYYRAVDQVLGGNTAYPRLLVDPYLGLRLVSLSGSLDFDVALGGGSQSASLSGSTVLVKPMLGAQVGLELSPQWALGLRGDIAGLAIGADESFAWGLWAGGRYRFSPGWAVQLGYQYKDSRNRVGEGISEFGLNQTQSGMWLGLDISL